MENAQGIIDNIVNDFESKPFNSPIAFFNELMELSKDWENFIYPKSKSEEELSADETRDWIYHSAKKVLIMEKVRRVLTFKGMSANLIKEELIKLNKYLINKDSRLKLNIKKDI